MIAFWIAIALLTGATLLLLVLPLLRRPTGSVDQATYDLAVYKDQLKEVERDRERGLLSEEQAAAARLELERRILSVAPPEQAAVTGKGKGAKRKKQEAAAGPAPVSGLARVAAIASVLVVPAGALALYVYLGSPGMPDQPHRERMVARMDMDQQGAEEMIALTDQLAARLEENPDNAEGWAMLGRSRAALGQYDGAVRAFRQAVQRGQSDAETWAALGEAQVAVDQGQVNPQAAVAFRNALHDNRQEPRARYYLGLFQVQQDEPRTALAIWRDLEKTSPPDAPWQPMIQDAIRQVAMQAGIAPVSVPQVHPLDLPGEGAEAAQVAEGEGAPAGGPDPGPRADADPGAEMRAQADARRGGDGFTAEEQEMISGMVQGLADRLEENPNDFEGWMRLGQAYMVLKRPTDAANAYGNAVQQRPDSLDALRALASAQAGAAQAEGMERPPAAFYATLERIVAANPDDVPALKLLGENAASAGDTEGAREYWTRLRDVLPEGSPDRAEVERRLDALGS